MAEFTADPRTGLPYSNACAWDLVPVTLGSGQLSRLARGILCETAGRAKLTMLNPATGGLGTVRDNVPLVAGWNPVHAWVIDTPSSGTAATGVFAVI